MSDLYLQFLIGFAAAGAIAFAALRVRFLKPSGAAATFILGTVVFGLGGVAWSIPLIVFFVLSSLLSKYSSRFRSGGAWGGVRGGDLDLIFEKGSTRDAGQVWANGGIAGIIVILHAIAPEPALFVAYLGALAAAAADTWGTEIGVLSSGRPLSVRTWQPVEPGTSGAVSIAGSLGAIAGAFSVGLSGIFWTSSPWDALPVVVGAGVTGMLADSIVGATLQGRYRCHRCGAITERKEHCTLPSTLIAGKRWMGNDLVNTVCCLAGAGVAYVIWMLIDR
jgi:uncharacterized protein (TIGR00297 family)